MFALICNNYVFELDDSADHLHCNEKFSPCYSRAVETSLQGV